MRKPAGRVLPPQQLFQGDVLSLLKSSLRSYASSLQPRASNTVFSQP